MRVKRYVVDSMPDALQLIRSELGKDAVILNTKEVRTGGLFGLFGKKKIEVLAAVDGGQSPKPALPSNGARPVAEMNRKVKELGAVKAYAASATSPPAPDRKAEPTAPVAVMPASDAEEPDEPPAEPAKRPDPPAAADSNRQLLEEIKQMKHMVEHLSRRQTLVPGKYPASLERWAESLREQEVDPAHVERLLDGAMAAVQSPSVELDDDLAKEMLKAEIRKIWPQDRVEGIQPDSKVVHFVGPTGVGKTTTIAKIAAEQVLKHRRKVGFITSDTYRIAAVEQLKTYATILNVPLEVVFSPHELTRAFAQLQDREIIFMDTAGRNFRNEMYVSELNSLLTTSGKSETYLVLSLTTRYRDMKAIVENFSRFKLDKVLFTKRDETDTYGAMLNMAMDYPLKFSYVTNGQNVPDDIALLHTETWIERILEGGAHE